MFIFRQFWNLQKQIMWGTKKPYSVDQKSAESDCHTKDWTLLVLGWMDGISHSDEDQTVINNHFELVKSIFFSSFKQRMVLCTVSLPSSSRRNVFFCVCVLINYLSFWLNNSIQVKVWKIKVLRKSLERLVLIFKSWKSHFSYDKKCWTKRRGKRIRILKKERERDKEIERERNREGQRERDIERPNIANIVHKM